jgi:hypothetical protein
MVLKDNKYSFDNTYEHVRKEFDGVMDVRKGVCTYDLGDILSMGFALFSLKSPSVLNFVEQTERESGNIKSVYRIKDFAKESQWRSALDNVEEGELCDIQVSLIHEIWDKSLEKSYTNIGKKYLQVNLDGTEHFSSKKISCPCCLKRELRNGETQYYHSLLAAVLVHPELKEVLPLETESILNCDGDDKNDCEQNAAKRLLKRLKEHYPDWNIMIVADALYACHPLLELLKDCGFAYILNVKPDSHKSLFSQFEGRKERGDIITYQQKEKGFTHYFEVAKNLLLNGSSDIRVHFMKYVQTDKAGKMTTFTWILPLEFKMEKRYFKQYMRAARARWKVENETFNTLKNQGYQFDRNFGHGQNFLASNFTLLMFLAFTIDQIQQWGCKIFKLILAQIKTKIKVWETLRAVFKILVIPDMKTAFFNIIQLFNIKIE